MKIGDLVRCHDWTAYSGLVGQIVDKQVNETYVDDCGNIYPDLYVVLIDGDVRKFSESDIEVINEKAKEEI